MSQRQPTVSGVGSADLSARDLDLELSSAERMDLSVVCGRFVNRVDEFYRIDTNQVLGR